MKSTLLIFILFAIHSLCQTDDFRPLPIPVGWRYDTSENGTDRRLPEDIVLEKATTHYWEEALKHSVYLALVRDRIDELIARGETKDTDSTAVSGAVHHNLWHKIKTASFQGISNEEPPSAGDVIIIARGRLIDFGKDFRFVEDRAKGEVCKDDHCMEGVKALWSVKRNLHRDDQTPGQHYELTFSVLTQRAKKHRKLHENPVRTFTVRETAPEVIVDDPKEWKSIENTYLSEPRHRGGGTIWFHKNIRPITKQQGRQFHDPKTDRIFTSFFSDDDHEAAPRRPFYNTPPPHSKIGHDGAPSDQHQQKKVSPFTYKQYKLHNPAKYSRPPSPSMVPHSQHHYLDIDAIGVVSNPYIHQTSDHTHGGAPKLSPPRPPVLPTPLPPHAKGYAENGATRSQEVASATSIPPEVITAHNRPLPTPMKISYFADHVRPPVYNTPPGVFVTMDKKPFKPLPPLKYQQHFKHKKPQKHLDFRPSPQVLDIEFSEPDPLLETAFRPITVNYAPDNDEAIVISKTNNVHTSNNTEAEHSKQNATNNFPSTTVAPITTKSNGTEEDGIETWTNLLGAFSKTTPMASQKDNADNITSSTTNPTLQATQTPEKNTTTTKSMENKNATIATTAAPKRRRRTRPPRKFKSKSNSTNTTKAPKHKRILPKDLSPQASSNTPTTTSMTTKSSPSSTSTTTTSTTTATRIINPTTAASTTKTPKMTTSQPTTVSKSDTQISTTTETQNDIKEKSSKNQNRYRQTTLMQKGTSVNHDKWSMNASESKSTVKTVPWAMAQNGRRNISKFQGYSATTIKPTDEPIEDFFKNWYLSTTQSSTDSNFETPADHFQSSLEIGSDETLNAFNDKYKSWDDYPFENDDNSTANKNDEELKTDVKPLNEVDFIGTEVSESQEEQEVVIPISEAPRVTPKPKCKNRNGTKTQPLTTPPTKEESELIASKLSEKITAEITTPDMFQELSDAFGLFNNIETESKSVESSKLEIEDIVDKDFDVKGSEKMSQRESKEYTYDDELESVGESISDERFYDDYEENPRSFFELLSSG